MTTVAPVTLGLDLGDNFTEICCLDAAGQVVERGRINTGRESLTALFQRYPDATKVFEVGSQSRWVQQLAKSSGSGNVITADPRQLHLISKSRRKNDRKDAFLLCRAGQGLPELLHPVEHRSEQTHLDLQVLRTREALVGQRTELINRIRGVVKSVGARLPSCDADYFFRKAKPHVPEAVLPACAPLFAILEALYEQLLELKKQIRAMRARYPAAAQLAKVPSVGELTALTFVLTIDDPARIRGCRNTGAYLGLTPKERESGDSSPQLRITKAGDARLRRLLVLCAHHLLNRGKDCRLRRWGLELCRRGGRNAKKRAVVAIARKLSVQLLSIWRSGEEYDPWRDASPEMLDSLTA